MMKKLYVVFRVGGYLGGLIGVVLLMVGRRMSPPQPAFAAVGGGLIIAGFVSFFLSYALYMVIRAGKGQETATRTPGTSRPSEKTP